MSKTLQFRRGSTTLLNTFAGSDGELFVDTSKATVVVMDGSTLGGTPLATEYFVTAALLRASTTATLGTVKVDGTSIVISSGTISVPTATTSAAGIFRIDGTSVVVSSGVISVTRNFTTSFAVSGTVVMSSPFMFRNRLINGNFQFWQRGTTTATTGTYLADRWIAQNISTHLQSTDTPNAAFPFSVEFGNTVATYPYIAQRLEPIEAASLVSSDLTISFWAKNTSGNATLYVELAYPQTTSVYTSTMINAGLASITLANPPTVSSWGYYTYTWSSSIMTTAFAQGLEVRIVRDNTAPSTTRVTGIQLESGTAQATPFERLPVQQQLALCQRYFESSGNGGAASTNFSGNVNSGSIYYAQAKFQVAKRVGIPVITNIHQGTSGFPSTASTANNIDAYGFLNYRTANATVNGGYFQDIWYANAEL